MHKRTFFSKIDNSLQYFAVQPSSQDHEAGESALFLSVHGASVEATNQAGAYGSKSWGTLAAATNRRPYGFDWEDWGQQDALEVLAEAKRIYQPDEQRIYLTGHSMGGHGTWYLGSMHPDQWAAIAPCAGWVHFGLYGGGGVDASDDPIETLLARAYNVSNPLKVIRNYKQHGIYVLHGDADRTVPISLARDMREKLGEFHKDLDFHEEPGGGHWYDMTDDPGADCVDYPPLFQFFARHRRTMPAEAKNVEFWTCSPSVASQNQWVEVQQQGIAGAPSMVNLEQSAPLSRVKGESKNVTLMTFTLNHFDKSRSLKLVLDGQTIEDLPIGADGKVTVRKTGAGWVADQAKPSDKYPARNGWFKKAFDNNFVFVYATGGTDEENAWSYAKARFDSQAWWYRGNGDVEIIADRDFRLADYRDQSVIVYGNSDTVTCWGALLKDSPVQIDRKGVHLPTDRIGGDDLAVLMVRPRPDSDTAQVGVVSGSGVKGQKLTMAFNYFLAGVHFPDLFVADSSMLTEGSSGVRMAGWFANDWSMNGADMVRR